MACNSTPGAFAPTTAKENTLEDENDEKANSEEMQKNDIKA